MEDIILKFKLHSHRRGFNWEDNFMDKSDYVNDFMFHNHVYGENIYNALMNTEI